MKRESIYLVGSNKHLNISVYKNSASFDKLSSRYRFKFDQYVSLVTKSPSFHIFIDQQDLFLTYVAFCEHESLIRVLKLSPKDIIVRTGNPYLYRVLQLSQSLVGRKTSRYKAIFHNSKHLLEVIVKLLLNIINAFILVGHKLLSTKQSVIILTSNNVFKQTRADHRIASLVNHFDNSKQHLIFFIRSNHDPIKLIFNFIRRRRIVFFTDIIPVVLSYLNDFIYKAKPYTLPQFDTQELEDMFLEALFEKHFNSRVTILPQVSRTLRYLFRIIKPSAVFGDNSHRTIFEIISANQLGIATYGFQNSNEFKSYMLNKFIKTSHKVNLEMLAHKTFFTWNSSWTSYYLNNGSLYKSENLVVGGYYRQPASQRPILLSNVSPPLAFDHTSDTVLWLLEVEVDYNELLPYIFALLEQNCKIEFKLRPQVLDCPDLTFHYIFEAILSKNKNYAAFISSTFKPFKELDLSQYYAAIGSYTTALIDCIMNGLPILIITSTRFGDCFELADKNIPSVFTQSSDQIYNNLISMPQNWKQHVLLSDILMPVDNSMMFKMLNFPHV